MKRKMLLGGLASLLVIVGIWLASYCSYVGQTDVYILNKSGKSLAISYFATGNGAWLTTPNYSLKATMEKSTLFKQDLYHPADFTIAVGNRLTNFFCTADLRENSLSHTATVDHCQGNCYFTQMGNNKLILVLEKMNPTTTLSQHHLV